jgi:hypothetical protein
MYVKTCINVLSLGIMIRKLFLTSLLASLVIVGSAQVDTVFLRKNIYTGMDSMISLFHQKNWEAYADYMLPALIDTLGGKETFVDFMEEQMEMLDSLHVDAYNKGRILQLVKTKSGYQCITEAFMQMTGFGMVISGASYDIGVSQDGIHWKFLRLDENAEMLNALIPFIHPELKLPVSQMVKDKTLEDFMKDYQVKYL